MDHQHQITGTVENYIIWGCVAMIPLFIICWGILKIIERKQIARVWNYPAIKSRFTILKNKIQFSSTPTELSDLRDQAEEFFYKFDNPNSHSVMINFYQSLLTQITYRHQDLKDYKKRYSNLRVSAIILLIAIFSSCKTYPAWSNGHGYKHCNSTTWMAGFK